MIKLLFEILKRNLKTIIFNQKKIFNFNILKFYINYFKLTYLYMFFCYRSTKLQAFTTKLTPKICNSSQHGYCTLYKIIY